MRGPGRPPGEQKGLGDRNQGKARGSVSRILVLGLPECVVYLFLLLLFRILAMLGILDEFVS